MRLCLPSVLFVASLLSPADSFLTPRPTPGVPVRLFSTVDAETPNEAATADAEVSVSKAWTAAEVKARLETTLDKLREKDATSPMLTKEVS